MNKITQPTKFYAKAVFKNPITGQESDVYGTSDTPEKAQIIANCKANDELDELNSINSDPLKKLAYMVDRIDWYACMSDSYSVAVNGEKWETLVRCFMAKIFFENDDTENRQRILDTWNQHADQDFLIADLAALEKKCSNYRVFRSF